MAAIAINDLPTNRALDGKAMSRVRGASAGWVFGWCAPFERSVPSALAGNFFQIINNNFVVGQMIDQSQTVNISNSGNNSSVTAVLIGAPSNAGPSLKQ